MLSKLNEARSNLLLRIFIEIVAFDLKSLKLLFLPFTIRFPLRILFPDDNFILSNFTNPGLYPTKADPFIFLLNELSIKPSIFFNESVNSSFFKLKFSALIFKEFNFKGFCFSIFSSE